MWFQSLTGFKEEDPEQVRQNISIDDRKLISKVNGREFLYGKFEIPSLAELREELRDLKYEESQIQLSEVVADVRQIHMDKENNRALVQVASQFNLLEMVGPGRTPELGVGIYEHDKTQGPACAIACGAGTIYRNYFVPVNGKIGQSKDNQIDCLKEIGKALGNDDNSLWTMQNGYALASEEGLEEINGKLSKLSFADYEALKGKLRVGVQWESEVTISDNNNFITQVYCSALPVAYSWVDKYLWEPFARLVLEATYEATLLLGLKNCLESGNNRVYLTLIGGGAFGNDSRWIFSAIRKAVLKYKTFPLDVRIVSYGRPNPELQKFLTKLKSGI